MGVYDFFFFKQKTAYDMRISNWSSDVCSSDLLLNLQTAGAVRLVLTLKHDDLDFGLVVNNRGIANLGRTQVQANATANSLFRQGYPTRLTVSVPTDHTEARRVGTEWDRTCRSRGSPAHNTKKTNNHKVVRLRYRL